MPDRGLLDARVAFFVVQSPTGTYNYINEICNHVRCTTRTSAVGSVRSVAENISSARRGARSHEHDTDRSDRSMRSMRSTGNGVRESIVKMARIIRMTRLEERRGLALCILLVSLLSITGQVSSSGMANDTRETWAGFSTTCTTNESKNMSVSCYGVRIVRNIMQQLMEKSSKEPNIEIFDGVNLVEVPGNSSPRKARVLKGFGGVGTLLQFLEGRELRIKLPSLLPQNIESALEESLSAEQARKGGGGFGGGYGGGGGGKGGKKGGNGGYVILALMMGKMMAAMGFGALGLLAMKALMVSAMALMLSLIVAVKKLTSGGDHGSGHHVVYAQEVGGGHHSRRKRSLGDDDLDPYRGYAHLFGDSMDS